MSDVQTVIKLMHANQEVLVQHIWCNLQEVTGQSAADPDHKQIKLPVTNLNIRSQNIEMFTVLTVKSSNHRMGKFQQLCFDSIHIDNTCTSSKEVT